MITITVIVSEASLPSLRHTRGRTVHTKSRSQGLREEGASDGRFPFLDSVTVKISFGYRYQDIHNSGLWSRDLILLPNQSLEVDNPGLSFCSASLCV